VALNPLISLRFEMGLESERYKGARCSHAEPRMTWADPAGAAFLPVASAVQAADFGEALHNC